jgi:cytochrome c oxidase subunit 2
MGKVRAMLAPRHRFPCARIVAVAACAGAIGGCGGDQSALNPRSEPARNNATLWWWMLAVAGVVFAGAVALLVFSWLRRGREGVPIVGERTGFNLAMVVLFGIGIPSVVLVALFVVANFVVMPSTEAPAASREGMTVEVIGAQWFWEVRYPDSGAVTANEIHIPVRTRVTVVATTADVIHSFWVPQLNRKIDMIPGRRNRVSLYAERPGRYRGQCAEFCGLQHSHMAMAVIADPPDRFDAWLADQARPAARPVAGLAARGEQVFMAHQCASCHAIRGTAAAGRVGPDLTHVGRRATLAALTLPNTAGKLAAWIRDPQYFKPGNRMPAIGLERSEIDAVTAYLRGLR